MHKLDSQEEARVGQWRGRESRGGGGLQLLASPVFRKVRDVSAPRLRDAARTDVGDSWTLKKLGGD